MKYYVDLNLNQNELQNAVLQNLASHPANPKPGQHYYNTTDHTEYFWNGTEWVNAAGNYTFKNGVEQVDGTRDVQIKLGTSTNAALTADANGLSVNVPDASTTTKGVIEIATDAEATAGTSEILAVNPKQLDTKVTKNADITAATKTKITYDAKGLVTAGADLEESDIPDLHLAKVVDVTATAAEVNILDGATLTTTELNYVDGVTSPIQEQLDAKLELDSLSIAAGSTNYLEYNNTNGQFGAKVDTNVTANSTNLVTSGAVKAAIDAAIAGGVHYAGTWDITSATDYSGITLPVTKGALFYVTGTGPKTIGGVEWNGGDYLLVNDDVAEGGSLVGKVEKIDNTESADIVRLNATQTLTNKTINADDNTISNLETDNLKSGVLQTSVRADGTATDTNLVSEKAVRDALELKQDKVATAVENNLATWDDAGNTKDSGKAFTTTVRASTSASDNSIATEKAVATFVENSIAGAKVVKTSTALTSVGGVCTWTINDCASMPYSISLLDADGNEVVADITYTSTGAVIKFNSATDLAAGAFTARILM